MYSKDRYHVNVVSTSVSRNGATVIPTSECTTFGISVIHKKDAKIVFTVVREIQITRFRDIEYQQQNDSTTVAIE